MKQVVQWTVTMMLIGIICIALFGCATRKVCTMEEWLVTSDCP